MPPGTATGSSRSSARLLSRGHRSDSKGGRNPAAASAPPQTGPCGPLDTPRRGVGALGVNGSCGDGPAPDAELCGPLDTPRRGVGALGVNGSCGDGPAPDAELDGPLDTPRRSVVALGANGSCGDGPAPDAELCGPLDTPRRGVVALEVNGSCGDGPARGLSSFNTAGARGRRQSTLPPSRRATRSEVCTTSRMSLMGMRPAAIDSMTCRCISSVPS